MSTLETNETLESPIKESINKETEDKKTNRWKFLNARKNF